MGTGIWISPSLEIQARGYFEFDKVFQGTDHRTLWVDITYNMTFGHNVTPYSKATSLVTTLQRSAVSRQLHMAL
jgi:hypothetical protein